MGNVSRIRKVMADANQGKEITVGFIGGSITMGSVATSPERCYAARVHAWWESAFPKAKINYVNAGIGATTSQFAVARAEEDLLAYSPDFVIVEFSVNDEKGQGFVRDNTSQNAITEIFRKGWLAGEKGAWLETVVTGRNIAVQYRKTIHRPAPIASISIDDGHKIILDANFTEEWGDCLYLQTLAEGLDEGEHKVRVELTEATRNDASPFYLVSLIVS